MQGQRESKTTSFEIPHGGSFRILQLTDIHIGGSLRTRAKDKMALNAVRTLVTAAKPDLVVLTGDNVFPMPFIGGTINNMRSTRMVGECMESLGVPWATVFGNHDTEICATHGKAKLAAYYESLPHCIFRCGEAGIGGIGNYKAVLTWGGEARMNLYFLDSNMYETNSFFSGFDNIHPEQVAWYERDQLESNAAAGRTVDGLMFFHIPFTEYREAWQALKRGEDDVYYYYGEVSERYKEKEDYFGVPKVRGEMFSKICELGAVKACFVGHDHLNTTCIEYRGVRLVYGLSIDYLAYPGIRSRTSQRGGTVIDVCMNDAGECVTDIAPLFLESIK